MTVWRARGHRVRSDHQPPSRGAARPRRSVVRHRRRHVVASYIDDDGAGARRERGCRYVAAGVSARTFLLDADAATGTICGGDAHRRAACGASTSTGCCRSRHPIGRGDCQREQSLWIGRSPSTSSSTRVVNGNRRHSAAKSPRTEPLDADGSPRRVVPHQRRRVARQHDRRALAPRSPNRTAGQDVSIRARPRSRLGTLVAP